MSEGTGGIFVSYRRQESSGWAGLAADKLAEHFGEDRVFRDIDSLEPGLAFAEAIERALDSSEVLIAVIGKNWLTVTDAAGRKRLENPNDYVRLEIATALKRKIRVIPLLVPGATMPSADELPADLADLAHRHAFQLSESSWRDDIRRLNTRLEKVVGPRAGEGRGPVSPKPDGRVGSAGNGPVEEGVGHGPIRQSEPPKKSLITWVIWVLLVGLLLLIILYLLGIV